MNCCRDDIYLFFWGEGEDSCYVPLAGLEITVYIDQTGLKLAEKSSCPCHLCARLVDVPHHTWLEMTFVLKAPLAHSA